MHEQEVGLTALEIPGAYAKRHLSCSPAMYVTVQALMEIRPASLKQPKQPLASRPKIIRRQNSPPSHSNCLPGFVLMEELHLHPGMARTQLVSSRAAVTLTNSEERCLDTTKTTPSPYGK